jgi:4-amino-4-deoxychorismate lyase
VKIYVNGSIVDEEQAVVSVYDHGFLYGMGLFETFRSYNRYPFLLDEHKMRLAEGCRQLGIAYNPDAEDWGSIIQTLLTANGLDDAYIRFTVTAGQEILGLPIGDYNKPSVLVYIKPLPPQNEQLVGQGKPLQLLELPRNTSEGPTRLKSLHYMNNILAKRELQKYPWAQGAEGLLLDASGYIAEGITSNVFFVKQGKLCTPSLATGILPGITRAFVMELAEAANIPVEEGLYGWSDLLGAEEVFITNSIQEIVPVSRLFNTDGNEKAMNLGSADSITCLLQKVYKQRIQASRKRMNL